MLSKDNLNEKKTNTDDGKLFKNLNTQCGFNQMDFEKLHEYSTSICNSGDYETAVTFLDYVCNLMKNTDKPDKTDYADEADDTNETDHTVTTDKNKDTDKRYLPALWKTFASDICLEKWNMALEDISLVRKSIENNTNHVSAKEDVSDLSKQWLIHRSLFVFFKHPERRSIIDMFLYQKDYLKIIRKHCCFILRYFVSAAIIGKWQKEKLKDLKPVIEGSSTPHYKDPIIDLWSLCFRHEHDQAEQKLKECESVLRNDFFLSNFVNDFMEQGSHLIDSARQYLLHGE